jgi:hypothetical protein
MSMRHAIARLSALGLLISAACGCSQLEDAMFNIGAWAGDTADSLADVKVSDDPMLIDVSGPLGVDVKNFAGDVVIDSNPTLERATVTITRYATHGYQRTDEAEVSLDTIDYSVELVPGELGQRLEIRTWTTHDEPYFQRVRIKVEAPDIEGIHVRNEHGKVRARDIAGAVDIVTGGGDVRVMSTRPMTRPVTIINNDGDIDYRVRGESTGRLDLQALRGRAFADIRHGDVRVLPGTDHDTVIATFNEGENPIVMRAADGDIRLVVVPDPTHVGKMIVK